MNRNVAIAIGSLAGLGLAVFLGTRAKASTLPPPVIPPPPPPPTTLANVYGLVLDEFNAPISGVTVLFDVFNALTDADGYYQVSNVTPGTYSMTFSKAGYDVLTKTVNVIEGNNRVDATLIATFQEAVAARDVIWSPAGPYAEGAIALNFSQEVRAQAGLALVAEVTIWEWRAQEWGDEYQIVATSGPVPFTATGNWQAITGRVPYQTSSVYLAAGAHLVWTYLQLLDGSNLLLHRSPDLMIS